MAELVCCQCGYELSGLSPEGVCPECARAIAESVRAAEGSVVFFRRVAVGSRIAGAGAGVLVPGWIVSVMSSGSLAGLAVLLGPGLLLWWSGWWVLGMCRGLRGGDEGSRAGAAIRSCIGVQGAGGR